MICCAIEALPLTPSGRGDRNSSEIGMSLRSCIMPAAEAHAVPARVPAEKLRAMIREEIADIVRIRRDLHAHPELAYEETRTSGVVAGELARLGIRHKAGMAGGTGVGVFRALS